MSLQRSTHNSSGSVSASLLYTSVFKYITYLLASTLPSFKVPISLASHRSVQTEVVMAAVFKDQVKDVGRDKQQRGFACLLETLRHELRGLAHSVALVVRNQRFGDVWPAYDEPHSVGWVRNSHNPIRSIRGGTRFQVRPQRASEHWEAASDSRTCPMFSIKRDDRRMRRSGQLGNQTKALRLTRIGNNVCMSCSQSCYCSTCLGLKSHWNGYPLPRLFQCLLVVGLICRGSSFFVGKGCCILADAAL